MSRVFWEWGLTRFLMRGLQSVISLPRVVPTTSRPMRSFAALSCFLFLRLSFVRSQFHPVFENFRYTKLKGLFSLSLFCPIRLVYNIFFCLNLSIPLVSNSQLSYLLCFFLQIPKMTLIAPTLVTFFTYTHDDSLMILFFFIIKNPSEIPSILIFTQILRFFFCRLLLLHHLPSFYLYLHHRKKKFIDDR